MSLTMLDLNSESRGAATVYGAEPLSPLPRIWIGFLISFSFLVAEIFLAVRHELEGGGSALLIAIAVCGWLYWLSCVHRFHKILGQISPHVGTTPTYPYEPAEAVGRHFIPFYNFFWIVKWPWEMTKFLKEQTSVRMVSGILLGFLMLASILVRAVDGFLGLTLMYCVGWYISRKLRRVMAEWESLRNAASAFT
jgi:hypothetical protein